MEHGIVLRGRLTNAELDRTVAYYIRMVGHAYGRRTLCGLLRSRGILVSERRVGSALRRVAPVHHRRRQYTAHQMLNPPVYQASYYGKKLNLDQNEKLVMYGVTHVVAVDGYSSKIVGFITIPRKNSIMIYDRLLSPLLHSEGLWEQVRVDHGLEFTLVVAAQQHLAPLRNAQSRHPLPVLLSMSRQISSC